MAHWAALIRSKEADNLRGKPQLLEQLEHRSDTELIMHWLWKWMIIGSLTVFIALPLFLGLVNGWLVPWLRESLWVLVKVAMGIMVVFGCCAGWLTFKVAGDQ